jgi:hypothetical protein
MNASGVVDWNANHVFADLVHCTARDWLTRSEVAGEGDVPVPKAWLDQYGYPVAVPPGKSAYLIVMYDLNTFTNLKVKQGTYVMRASGELRVRAVTWNFPGIINIRPGDANETLFDVNGDTPTLVIEVTNVRTTPAGCKVEVFHQDFRSAIDGDQLNPDWVAFYRSLPRLKYLRVMDLMHTNNSNVINPEDVVTEQHQSWCREGYGAPPSVIGRIAKELNIPLWVCFPYMGTKACFRFIAQQIALHYPTGLSLWAQYGNELFNFLFRHWSYLANVKSVGLTLYDQNGTVVSAPSNRAAGCAAALGMFEVWSTCDEVFGADRVFKAGDGHPEWHDLMASWVQYRNPDYYGGKRAGEVATHIPTTLYWGSEDVDFLLTNNAGSTWTEAQFQALCFGGIRAAVAERKKTKDSYTAQGITIPYAMYEGGGHHAKFEAWPDQKAFDDLQAMLERFYRGPGGEAVYRKALEATAELGCIAFAKFVDFGGWRVPPAHQLMPFGAGKSTIYDDDTPMWTYFRTLAA